MRTSVNRSTHIWSSPLLLIILLLATSALAGSLAATLYQQQVAHRAPEISGYDWSQHPDVLLVVHPPADSCSTCNLSLADWAKLGQQHHLDVLVVAAADNFELKSLRKEKRLSQAGLSIITGVEPKLIKQFSVDDRIGGVHIRDGRIVARQVGGSPSEAFFQPSKRK